MRHEAAKALQQTARWQGMCGELLWGVISVLALAIILRGRLPILHSSLQQGAACNKAVRHDCEFTKFISPIFLSECFNCRGRFFYLARGTLCIMAAAAAASKMATGMTPAAKLSAIRSAFAHAGPSASAIHAFVVPTDDAHSVRVRFRSRFVLTARL